jgi:hypothetical protein
MQKTKVTTLFSKFAVNENPFRTIAPFLLAALLFATTITPLYFPATLAFTVAPTNVLDNGSNFLSQPALITMFLIIIMVVVAVFSASTQTKTQTSAKSI